MVREAGWIDSHHAGYQVTVVASSVFARNCTRCKFLVIAQQFRARELLDCDLMLFSMTEPVLEMSERVRVGCWPAAGYPKLRAQMAAAGLDPWNNRWSEVHNFTPEFGGWLSLDEDAGQLSTFTDTNGCGEGTALSDELAAAGFDGGTSVVPWTAGLRGRDGADERCVCFVVFDSTANVGAWFAPFGAQSPGGTVLVQTRRTALSAEQAGELFAQHPSMRKRLAADASIVVLGLEWAGPKGASAKVNFQLEEHAPGSFVCMDGAVDNAGVDLAVKNFFVHWRERA